MLVSVEIDFKSNMNISFEVVPAVRQLYFGEKSNADTMKFPRIL